MVSTNKTKVHYSKHLNSMIRFVKKSLSKCKTQQEIEEVKNGLLEFCYNYPENFINEFHKRIGIIKNQNIKRKSDGNLLKEFVNFLSKKDSECVFLLRDSLLALKKYQQNTGKGFGILINRKYLFDKEEDYFLLVDIFYSSLLNSKNKKEFLDIYFLNFKRLIQKNKNLYEKSKEIYEGVKSHKKSNSLLWTDMGFHFTFCLFGLCSVKLHSKKKIKQDVILLSVYPWLKDFFKTNYFTRKNEYVLNLEKQAIIEYNKSILQKSQGCFVGFAIGDSLGFPIAGIDKTDIRKFQKNNITDFGQNKEHPYFSNLKKGQYTDNTNLLILSINNLIENRKFNIQEYEKSLVGFLKENKKERWLGPTALKAIEKLSQDSNFKNSGSKTTESCSSTYRVIPLGIFYKDKILKLKKNAEISGMITHNSEISKTGAVLTTLIISNLINFDLPETAIRSAVKSVSLTSKNKKLIKKIEEAILFSKTKSITYARKHFGTGSPIYQTLPLAVFCFLKYPNDFEKAILLAINSFRDDNAKEKKRLKNLSWEEQLQEANGGNTDGIAGLTGAFSGSYLGINNIPKKFLKVENSQYLMKLGRSIIETQ